MLQFDVGDAFQPKYDVTDKDRAQVLAAADLYMAAFSQTKLDAYNVGDRDLALGRATLEKLAKRVKFPFLSANLVDAKTNKPVFKPSILLEAAGMKVAVIGATTTLFVSRDAVEKANNLRVTEPHDAVKAEVARQKAAGATLFVLLAHLNDKELETVVAQNPEIQIALGGQTYRMESALKRFGKAYMANGYFKGKNISVLDLGVNGGSLAFTDRNAKTGLQSRKRSLTSQIAARERSIKTAKENPARKSSVEYLERNLVQLKTQLQEVTMDLEDAVDPDPNASWLKWKLEGMDKHIADDKTILDKVTAYRAKHPDPTKAKRKGIPARPPSRMAPVRPMGRTATPPARPGVRPVAPAPARR